MPSSQDYVDELRSWLGVRWIHQGRGRTGVDCIGLAIVGLAAIGIEVADKQGYRRTADKEVFIEHIRSLTQSASEPAVGHLGIFRESSQPCHVGIFAERDGVVTLVHAYAGVGKVIEEPFIHDWPGKLIEIRRLGELT